MFEHLLLYLLVKSEIVVLVKNLGIEDRNRLNRLASCQRKGSVPRSLLHSKLLVVDFCLLYGHFFVWMAGVEL